MKLVPCFLWTARIGLSMVVLLCGVVYIVRKIKDCLISLAFDDNKLYNRL